MPNNYRNITPDHVEDLEEISPLPDLTESQRQQQKIEDVHDIDNQLDTTTLPNLPKKLPTRYYILPNFPETLKYWVGNQRGHSYLMGRRCLFSIDWPPF